MKNSPYPDNFIYGTTFYGMRQKNPYSNYTFLSHYDKICNLAKYNTIYGYSNLLLILLKQKLWVF